MSRGQMIILILAAVVAGGSLGGLTAPASREITQAIASRELVVFETEGCVYCRLFRRDVVPDYLKSEAAQQVPLRFVDVDNAGSLEPFLSSPLTIIPTTVLLVDGREAGRIAGYPGSAAFQQMVSHMLTAP